LLLVGCSFPDLSAGTRDRASGGVKEIGGPVEPSGMDTDDQVAAPGRTRLGRLGRLGAGLPRPTGIRNGGLLLVLVGLAAVMALVDRPPEPVASGPGGGIFQHLPPPVGITSQLPPVADQPSTPAGGQQVAALGTDGERPAASDRAHPRRLHPRPTRSGSSGLLRGDVVTRPVGGGSGSGSGGSGSPVVDAPATQVRVAPVTVRVSPPPVLGRDLPDVQIETPEVRAETPGLTLGS
jgi:hypothetical protein